MNSNNCIKCGGTGVLVNGEPCPDCVEVLKKNAQSKILQSSVPTQYQAVTFSKELLPFSEQKGYGEFMENLLTSIYTNCSIYQKNILICSKPNTGKTIWAYTLINMLAERGYAVPPILDLVQVREVLNFNKASIDLSESVTKSRCLIVKIPSDVTFWMIDIISYILERRVPNNGFTIFLFNGCYSQLEQADKNNRLKYIKGTGNWHTLRVEDFKYE